MLKSMSTKGALTATTSVAALGLVALVILPKGGDVFDLPKSGPDSVEETTVAEPQRTETLDDRSQLEGDATASQNFGLGTNQDTDAAAGLRGQVASENAPVPTESLAEPVMEPAITATDSATVGQLSEQRSPQALTRQRVDQEIVQSESFVPSPSRDIVAPTEPNTEAFSNEAPNPLKIASEEPVSTFSIDVDTASYSVLRSSLTNGYLPDPNSVRVEEMVNYFPYAYPAPDGDHPFSQTVTVTPTPWNDGTQLVHIGIQGELPAIDDRPPLNLVFLIDTSGSMGQPDKLPLLIQSFRLMVSELRPEDQVAIVTYAGSAGLVLEPTPASERDTILGALSRLSAGGSTAGQAGLQQAYSVAENMAEDGEVNRVILATDGDFNVGISDPEQLKTYIENKRESGTYLSVLGFGRGNLDDATMQTLAQNGNGTAAYIDTLSEAQKVLVDQLSGALFPIANDVKIQVEFNPAQIAEYRLIGYETRALRREDFNNDKVDAGEIGAGHSVTAIYEITPVGSDAVLTDTLRYAEAPASDGSDELGFLKLRYKTPGEDTSQLIETPIIAGMGQANEDTRFATAIAGFGQLLRGTDYLGDWSYQDAITLANSAKGDDPYGYRAEAVTLMRLADSLSDN
ncbi:vWA domain-containing protein [Aliiroseovarius sp. YM-037]|uniref:vWA domain-containing protein n=1 Tax=Aliiroseovarius sp. YM-037 TaxID=3341728 RepID=UPI003A80F37D